MIRKYKGNAPKDGTLLFSLGAWNVWRRPVTASGWRSIKVTARDPQPHKGNYWLGWHTVVQRWGGEDCELLREREPEIVARLEELAEHGELD